MSEAEDTRRLDWPDSHPYYVPRWAFNTSDQRHWWRVIDQNGDETWWEDLRAAIDKAKGAK